MKWIKLKIFNDNLIHATDCKCNGAGSCFGYSYCEGYCASVGANPKS